ncbi:isopentenyl transferase family protein [Lentzea sp. NPDC004789]
MLVRAIVGPTGIGKSAVATELASATGAPILVADRIQCYTDLTVSSARAESAEGVHRVWLAERTVGDGDYPPGDAAEMLLTRLCDLVEHHRLVVLEGGSISVMLRFAENVGRLPFPVSVQVLRIGDKRDYVARLRARARSMLFRDQLGRSVLTEFVAAWTTPGQRLFTASLSGMDSILEWCAKYSVPPEDIADIDIPPERFDELAGMIGERYAEHGFVQDKVFAEVFGRHAGH